MKVTFRNIKHSIREIKGVMHTLDEDVNFSNMCEKARLNHLYYMNGHREAIIAHEDKHKGGER